jgi:hypothetical protein
MERVADRGDRSVVAAAHAGRPHDADIRPEGFRQLGEQLARPHHLAAETVADPHGYGGRRFLAVENDIEMRIERGNLVDLDQGEPHLLGERREMGRAQIAVMVLDQMEMLDQQVPPARTIAEHRTHLVERLRIDLPSLRRPPPLTATGTRMNAPNRFLDRLCHGALACSCASALLSITR